MTIALNFTKTRWLILPLLVVLSLVGLILSPIFESHSHELTNVIIFDFLFTTPFIYFLVIRKTDIPKITVVSVFIVCMMLTSHLLPKENQQLLSLIKTFALPLAEVLVLSFVFFKARKMIKQYKIHSVNSLDFYTIIKAACKEVLPKKIAMLFATEIGVVYYSIFAPLKAKSTEGTYSYYKKSGVVTVVYALMFLIIMETLTVHLLLHENYNTFAWVVSGLSAYTCLQVFALIRSLPHRMISIDKSNSMLHLKYGFFCETDILISDIESIIESGKALTEDSDILKFSPIGDLDSHNLILHLKSENRVYRIYGIEKKYKSLAIYVDDKNRFLEELGIDD